MPSASPASSAKQHTAPSPEPPVKLAQAKFATEEEEKLYMNRMRSKVNRMCCRTSTGKLQVSEEVHKIWAQAGTARYGLVEIMADCDGQKDSAMLV